MRNFTILTVDDEPDITELISYHLVRAGYRVLTAGTGREALDIIASEKPDLVLLDLMLPDIDGFGVCEILRHNTATATVPIVIISAWASGDSRNVGLELGALDYITKPFSPGELLRKVISLLEMKPVA